MTSRRQKNVLDDESRAVELLRHRRLRVTRVRLAVLAAMQVSDVPVTHGDLVRRLARRGHDRATIFRTLATLTRVGIVRRIDVGDHVWRFSLARGTDPGPTASFVCTSCGHIEVLESVELRVSMPRAPRVIAKREIELHVHGRCDACAQ